MKKLKFYLKKIFSIIFVYTLIFTAAKSEDGKIEAIADQIQIISKDLATLEKAVYKKSDVTSTSSAPSNNLNEDVLTKHLLKLNEVEEQFRE